MQENPIELPEIREGRLKRFWRDNRQFLFLLLCIVFFKSAIADFSSVSGASMQPTLLDGDKIWVNKLAYDVRIPFTEIALANVADPQRGDIVIIDSERAEKRLVKRVIGLPGDTVLLRDNRLEINGQPAAYEKISETGDSMIIIEALPEHEHQAKLSTSYYSRNLRNFGPVVVPEGHYFVLGDNHSADSRAHSFIPREEIIGRSSSVLFSLDAQNRFLPRVDRFLSGLQ